MHQITFHGNRRRARAKSNCEIYPMPIGNDEVHHDKDSTDYSKLS
jgi:hypothetical protein